MGEVFGHYVDTAGNEHFFDTETGEHILRLGDAVKAHEIAYIQGLNDMYETMQGLILKPGRLQDFDCDSFESLFMYYSATEFMKTYKSIFI